MPPRADGSPAEPAPLAPAPAPDAPAPDDPRAPTVRTALVEALMVCWRCAAVLTVLAVVLGAVGVATGGADGAASIVVLVWLVHLLVLAVVGYPMGLVLARLVPQRAGRAQAAGWFALAGALPGLFLLPQMGVTALVWVGLGAVVAGGSRAWAHPALVARRAR